MFIKKKTIRDCLKVSSVCTHTMFVTDLEVASDILMICCELEALQESRTAHVDHYLLSYLRQTCETNDGS